MRKRLAVMLAAVMAVSLAGCGSTPKESSTEAAGASETQAESVATEGEENFKIGILTSTVSQAEEEYRAAESVKEKYGDRIIKQQTASSFQVIMRACQMSC